MSAIVGVIWFVVAKWIWDLNESGRLFILVIAVVNLIVLVLAILGQTTFQAVALQVIVNVLALVLALLPSTEEAFRGAAGITPASDNSNKKEPGRHGLALFIHVQ